MSSIKLIVTLALITTLSLVSIGCSDDTTSIVDPPVVVVEDTAPPAVPANLGAEFYDGEITLSWDQNTTDSDLAGFIVSRDNYGVVTSLVSTPTILQSIDDSPAMGLNIYQVYSVDQVGNASAVATVEYRRIGRHDPEEDLTQE